MKKLLFTLVCLPIIGFSQTTWTPCDSSFSISINSQDSIEVVYSVSGPNFNMIGQCIGGSNSVASYIDTLNALNINNITDSTAIMCLISDSLSSCTVLDTLVYDSLSGWSLLSGQFLTTQTYVPDDNFENYLEANGMGNGLANDDYVTTANIDTVPFLNVSGQSISDLTGIEDFISIVYLQCNDNQLTILDLSSNTTLSYLECWGNQLTTLDLSNNTYLEYLVAYSNNLQDIDLSNNHNLLELDISDNLLYSLDLSFQDIQFVSCQNNQITDFTINSYSLKELDCGNNPVFLFDATNHPNLESLEIYNTGIFNIDLSQNLDLSFLSIGSNPNLWSLDLSNNYNLEFLDVWANSLSYLDMRNGNNQNVSYFVSWQCFNSQYLECINVDDSLYSTNNWTSIDPWQYFSDNCEGSTSIEENTTNKELLKVTDLIGREAKGIKNELLFYIYDDGTVEKRIVIE